MTKMSATLTGQKFGKLVVVALADSSDKPRTHYLCQCECGRTTIVYTSSLTRGLTRSCGCGKKESSRERMTTHGLSGTRFWKAWANVLTRNSGEKRHLVDERWFNFDLFKEDMYERYQGVVKEHGERGTRLILVNKRNGVYNAENCKWEGYRIAQRKRKNIPAQLTLQACAK